jgi:Flp pilus assembly protein TadD
MTTIQHDPTATSSNPTPESGFQSIPTRIRDMRDGEIPPLVVEPTTTEDKQAICAGLTELGTKLAEIHRTAAEAYLSQGLYEESLPHLEAAATFSPSDLDYHMQLGFVQYVTGDDVAAVKSFNKVITDDENHGEAWFNLGMVVFGQEQYTEAEFCFRRACELEGDDAQTWNNRGVCLWKLERADEARTCFENALKLDPNDEDAHHNLQHLA